MWINEFESERDGRNHLIVWEPLDTDAPPEARPHCCYLDWVVFYKHPHQVQPDGALAEWDRVTTRFNLLGVRWTQADISWSALAPFVQHDGVVYELVGGDVVWRDGCGWYLRWRARRVPEDDRRLAQMREERLAVAESSTRALAVSAGDGRWEFCAQNSRIGG